MRWVGCDVSHVVCLNFTSSHQTRFFDISQDIDMFFLNESFAIKQHVESYFFFIFIFYLCVVCDLQNAFKT
ncbi:CLUMA_CG012370, isoform A [Clunio marinus]|uniref:CLUMA_CG012370, isoform A n=1 Tax=Clunio marinus TaxID=568069 RepID=A0A1J1IEP0_9DIPT|nr:CLUMA_CG012370, isoform A [Clunio marinus]